MKTAPGTLAVLGAIAVGGAASYYFTRRAIRTRCRAVVMRECQKIPVFGTVDYCSKQADDVCVGERGARQRVGVEHVSQGPSFAGSFDV